MTELRPADPRARTRAIWLLIAGLAVALFTVFLLPGTLETWLTQDGVNTSERIVWLIRGLGVFLLISLCLPSAYLFMVAARVKASGEFPPPGMALVKAVQVLRGDAAIKRVRLLRGLGLLLIALALANAVMMWTLANTMRY